MSSRNEIVTFEQVNRVYAACAAWARATKYPLMAWYKGACEAVTGMPEITRPNMSDAATARAYGFGSAGHIPECLLSVAGSASIVSSEELWAD